MLKTKIPLYLFLITLLFTACNLIFMVNGNL